MVFGGFSTLSSEHQLCCFYPDQLSQKTKKRQKGLEKEDLERAEKCKMCRPEIRLGQLFLKYNLKEGLCPFACVVVRFLPSNQKKLQPSRVKCDCFTLLSSQ